MAEYCTISDLERRSSPDYVKSLSDDKGRDLLDSTLLGEIVDDAGVIIDQKLTTRYDVPFTAPIADIIVLICADITLYNLSLRRFRNKIPSEITDKYESALSLLEQIRTGKMTIIGLTEKTHATGPIAYNKDADDRVITDTLLGKML